MIYIVSKRHRLSARSLDDQSLRETIVSVNYYLRLSALPAPRNPTTLWVKRNQAWFEKYLFELSKEHVYRFDAMHLKGNLTPSQAILPRISPFTDDPDIPIGQYIVQCQEAIRKNHLKKRWSRHKRPVWVKRSSVVSLNPKYTDKRKFLIEEINRGNIGHRTSDRAA